VPMAYSCPQLISRLTSIGQQAYYLIALKQEWAGRQPPGGTIPRLWTHIISRLSIFASAGSDGAATHGPRLKGHPNRPSTRHHIMDEGAIMATAREIMTGGAECVGENETLEAAARKMKDLDVGSLPICGEDNRLKGMLTDRDIVVKCLAEGGDPRTATAGQFGEGKPVTIGADDSIEEAIRTMQDHQVRRLPVIDGHNLVGVLSQADIAKNYPEDRVGELVAFISY
jgi:CBS domain-containing protein